MYISENEAELITKLLWELYSITDNVLYHNYSPESLNSKLNEIEKAINSLER